MIQRVVFPSFRSDEYTANEIRQLVSALELRFQSLESNQDLTVGTGAADTDFLDDRYSQLNHTHIEDDITNLQDYLTNLNAESIFDLSDVSGAPELNDSLVWNGNTFVAAPGVALLTDLVDVHIENVLDNQLIQYNDVTQVWENVTFGIDDLSDVNVSGGVKYDMLFKNTFTTWTHTGGRLQWNHDNSYLQLSNDHAVNWLDVTTPTPLSREMLIFNSEGAAGGTVEHLDAEVLTEASTTSGTFVDITGAVITGASFTVGNEYLCLVRTAVRNSSSITPDNYVQLTLNDTLVTGSDWRHESQAGNSTSGHSYGYAGWFTYAAGDLQMEFRNGGVGTTFVNGLRMYCMNLTDLTADNYERSADTGTTACTDAGWTNTAAAITIGNSSDDWLIFFSVTLDNPPAPAQNMQVALDDGAAQIQVFDIENENSADRMCVAGSLVVQAPASTTYTLAGRTAASSTESFSILNANIIAIRLNGFAQHEIAYTADPTDPPDGLELTMETLSFTNDQSTGDWAFFGHVYEAWISAGNSSGVEIQADINGAGDALVSWDNTYTDDSHNPNVDVWTRSFFPTTTTNITSGHTVDADLNVLPANPPTSNDFLRSGLIAFSYLLADTSAEVFRSGNDAYRHDVKGLAVRIPSAAGTDWLEMDHVGTTFNYTYESVDTVNNTGAATLYHFDNLVDAPNMRINTGGSMGWFDSTETDSATFSHDDTDFNSVFVTTTDWNIVGLTSVHLDEVSLTLSGVTDANTLILEHTDGLSTLTTTNTHLEVDLAAGAGELRLRSGTGLEIYDSTNTDLALFNHDGTDFNTAFTTTTDWNITGLTGQTNFDRTIKVNTNAFLGVLIYDAGDASFANFYHDGTDFNTDFTTTTEWNITNLRIQHAGTMTSSNDTTGDGDNFFVSTSGKATTLWAYGLDRGGAEAGFFVDGRAKVITNAGTGLRVYDVSDGNYGDFHHDGTDFHFEFVTTTDLNITGITSIQAGTVDADFDAITGTSYGGILETNLLSRIVAEDISNDWTWGSANDIIFDGGVQTFTISHTDAATSFTGTGTHLNVTMAGGGDLRLRASTGLSIWDSTNLDLARFSHDDTDFNTVFTTTADWNITGITTIQAGTVDADFDEITGTGATFDLSAVSAPSYSFTSDDDTGVTSNAADEVQVATGAIAAITWTEASSHVLAAHETEVGMTAFATGGQGSATQITSSYNVFSTVATGGDSSKLPATFAVGTKVYIKNDGAAAMDVFPSTGDDLGAGTDTAVSVGIGAGAIFVATVVDATWTQML